MIRRGHVHGERFGGVGEVPYKAEAIGRGEKR